MILFVFSLSLSPSLSLPLSLPSLSHSLLEIAVAAPVGVEEDEGEVQRAEEERPAEEEGEGERGPHRVRGEAEEVAEEGQLGDVEGDGAGGDLLQLRRVGAVAGGGGGRRERTRSCYRQEEGLGNAGTRLGSGFTGGGGGGVGVLECLRFPLFVFVVWRRY